MFKRVFLAGVASVALICGVGSQSMAASSDSRVVPWTTTADGWEISVHRNDNTCSMYRMYEKGTSFMVGYNRKSGGYWMGIGRDDWADRIEDDAVYTMTVITDGRRWTGKFFGNATPGKHGAFMSESTLTRDFVIALARANRVEFEINGKLVRGLTLDGSYQALIRLGECQREMGW